MHSVMDQQFSPEKRDTRMYIFQATLHERLPLLVTGKASSLTASATAGIQM